MLKCKNCGHLQQPGEPLVHKNRWDCPRCGMSHAVQGPFPECEKWAEVADEASACEAFLSWLGDEKGIHLCERGEFGFQPSGEALAALLYEFFEIDGNKLEAERRAILKRDE